MPKKNRWTEFIVEHKIALLIMVLLFTARLYVVFKLGIEFNLDSDDMSYVESGIYFARHGVITMHDRYPSAQIMPGMTWLIGLLSFAFGEGRLLWFAMKMLWIVMGTLSAWYIYKSVYLFAPKWCGIVAMLPLFRPDYMRVDNIILTETPFLLALVMMVYYTLKMGKEKPGYKNFICCMIAYFFGLMLKANIALYPLFALVYLVIVKYDRKLLLKQCGILAVAVLCFVIPWSIRNYKHFGSFVPLTYGAGNPTLLGTYQGQGYPTDEELDYQTNVENVLHKEYAEYFNEDGTVKPEYLRYVSLQRDAIKASYRQKVWLETEPIKFVYSYLISKPLSIITSVYYSNYGMIWRSLKQLTYLEVALCTLIAVLALAVKKYRSQIFFVLALYLGNIYIYAATFAYSRYNTSLAYLKYIAIGIGIGVLLKVMVKGYHKYKERA